jgi:SAM-dependent methyltransferase
MLPIWVIAPDCAGPANPFARHFPVRQDVRVRERRLVFGEVAREYDEVRAGYPAALVDAVFGHLGRVPERIVEVGAGTGKGTAAFAGRGAAMTCLEPDPAMARVLRERFPAADVRVLRFEDFVPPPGGVPLVICAQAWHWVPPELRLDLAHRALAPGGVLALFGHRYGFVDDALEADLNRAYAAHAPALLDQEHGPPPPPEDHWMTRELAGHPGFTAVTGRGFERVVRYPTARYTALLTTFSPHRLLPEPQRVALHAALAGAVDAHGGVVDTRLSTTLSMARRAS